MLQASLFGFGAARVAPAPRFTREYLDECCWVARSPTFVLGADDLLDELAAALPLRVGKRLIYGEWLDEPRLSGPVDLAGCPIAHDIADALNAAFGDRLDACWANLYRDGSDSVAWHGDRIGRTSIDPLVAIVSLGGPRRFALRPRTKGKSHSYVMYSGDALVMGGACQHHFEHSIPKVASAPPRMSLTFRNAAMFEPPE